MINKTSKIDGKIKYNNGYTLLFAVLVSSLVLAVGISILTISKKEFLLSSAARESVYAFYAADSGLECAVYWDGKGKFATCSPDLSGGVLCGGIPVGGIAQFPSTSDIYGTFRTVFHVKNGDLGSCAIVTIIQRYVPDQDSGILIPETDIESRGYNMGWDSTSNNCNTSSVSRVERAIKYKY